LVRAKALEFRLLSQERLIAYQRKVIRDPQLLIDKIEKTKNKLAGLEKRFIPEQRLTKFFDDLKGLVSNTDNRLLSLDIMPAINNGTYEKLPFIISLRGYYVDIVSFLNKLEGYPRLIDIKDIKIQPVGMAERSSEIMMSLEAEAFAIKD
jgi:Tfp pilus assembly protein PilO